MKISRITSALLWMPRVLAIGLALFLAMFASDVFLEGNDFYQTTAAFMAHLIPSFAVIAILVIGWRRDGLAAIGFLSMAIGYFIALSGWKHGPESLVLSLPPLGTSLAFFARMHLRKLSAEGQDEPHGE
jgi:hypothetical protein